MLVPRLDAFVLPDIADPSAALRLCVAENLFIGFPKSTLGRALFKGLPTAASAGVSPRGLGAAGVASVSLTDAPVTHCGVAVTSGTAVCVASGVALPSGSAECARLSCVKLLASSISQNYVSFQLTRIRLTPSASSPPDLASSGATFPSLSLSSSILIMLSISSSSSSSLSSAMFPLLFFRALLRRAASSASLSRNAENPTVPPDLSGAMLEKSRVPDRRFACACAAEDDFGPCMTPIFCSWPA